jgi:hypothetical protein
VRSALLGVGSPKARAVTVNIADVAEAMGQEDRYPRSGFLEVKPEIFTLERWRASSSSAHSTPGPSVDIDGLTRHIVRHW